MISPSGKYHCHYHYYQFIFLNSEDGLYSQNLYGKHHARREACSFEEDLSAKPLNCEDDCWETIPREIALRITLIEHYITYHIDSRVAFSFA